MNIFKKQLRSKYRAEYPSQFIFDYKDPVTLSRFISEGGKVTPSRISKLSMSQQRTLAREIKKARNLALLPSGSDAYDNFYGAEQVSPKPFSFE